jgi:hypothetical protein
VFIKLSPQKVQHSSGYIVLVRDRFSIEYVDGDRKASVEVEFGSTFGVYARTLRVTNDAGNDVPASEEELAQMVERIVEGMRAMAGSPVETW